MLNIDIQIQKLSPKYRQVFDYLRNGPPIISQEDISLDLNINIRTVRRIIHRLKKDNLISYKRKNVNGRHGNFNSYKCLGRNDISLARKVFAALQEVVSCKRKSGRLEKTKSGRLYINKEQSYKRTELRTDIVRSKVSFFNNKEEEIINEISKDLNLTVDRIKECSEKAKSYLKTREDIVYPFAAWKVWTYQECKRLIKKVAISTGGLSRDLQRMILKLNACGAASEEGKAIINEIRAMRQQNEEQTC